MPNLQGVSGGVDLDEISVSATNAGVVTVSADGESTTRTITNSYDAGNSAGVSATKVGTAGTGEVLSGKTFTNASSVGATGTMTNRGAWTGATSGSGNVTIPAGYHNGSGYVSGSGAYNSGYSAGYSDGLKLSPSVIVADGYSDSSTVSFGTVSGRYYAVSINVYNDYSAQCYSFNGLSVVCSRGIGHPKGGSNYTYICRANGSSASLSCSWHFGYTINIVVMRLS